MATELASQLKKLATAENRAVSAKKHKLVSLLFTPQQALDVSLDRIYELAIEGLEELRKMDERFATFFGSLFDDSSKGIERELQDQEFNENLDKSLHVFLRLLSNFFLLRPAHKTFEYLLRRYRIHKYNVNSIMSCILPYYETNLFGRVVHLLKFTNTPWDFLGSVRKESAPLNRVTFIEACSHNFAVLQFVCEMIKEAVTTNTCNKTTLSFYGSTLTQVVSFVNIDDTWLAKLLPYLLYGAKSQNIDYQLATFMVISQLSVRTTLSDSLLETFFDFIIKSITDATINDALLCIAFLCQTQKLASIKLETLNKLLSLENFFPVLNVFLENNYDLFNFFALLLDALAQNYRSKEHIEALEKMLTDVPLAAHIATLTENLLQQYLQQAPSKKEEKKLRSVLQMIASRYPQELDEGLNKQLSSDIDEELKPKLFEFVGMTFQFSKHQPVKEAQTTLFLALQHPEGKVRLLALNTLEKMMRSSNPDKEFVSDIVAQRLSDDEPEILVKLLSNERLADFISPDVLLKKFDTILSSSNSDLVKRAALNYLAKNFLPQYPASHSQQAISLLFPHLLVLSDTISINLLAIEVAGQINLPLVHNFRSLKASSETAPEAINVQLVSLLASNLSSNFDTLLPFFLSFLKSATHLSKLLAILVLNKALHVIESFEKKLSISEALVQVALEDIETLSTRISTDQIQDNRKVFSIIEAGLPTAKVLKEVVTQKPKRNSLYHFSFFSLRNVLMHVATDLSEIDFLLPLSSLKEGTPAQRYFYVLHQLFLLFASKMSIGYCIDLLKLVLKNLGHQLLKFLSIFWVNEESQTPIAVLAKTFQFASAYVTSLQSSHDFQSVLPALLVPLNSSIEVLRRQALAVIQELLKKHDESSQPKIWGSESGKEYYGTPKESIEVLDSALYVKFGQMLLNFKEEISTDHTFFHRVLSMVFGEAKKGTFSFSKLESHSLGMYLISHATSFPNFGRYVLLSSMSHIKSPAKLLLLHPLLQTYLDSASSHSHLESKVLQLILAQFSEENISVLASSNSEQFASFIRLFSLPSPKFDQVKEQILSQISQLFVDGLSAENQRQLLKALHELVLRDETVALQARTVLKQSSAPAQRFAELLQACLPAPEEAPSEVTKKRRAKAVETPSKIISEESLPILNLVLEIMLSKNNVKDEMELVHSLFQLLQTLQALKDPEIEYTRQIILENLTMISERYALTHKPLSETPRTRKKNSSISKIEKDFDIDTAITCLKSSVNPQTHNDVLLFLASIGPLFPNLVLTHVMTLVTFMGTSVLQQDDNYTFYVIQKAIQQIIPSVVQVEEDVKPILQMFVNNLQQIPVHRQLALFQTIIKTLSAEKFLLPLLILLFVKHAHDSQSTIAETVKKTHIPAFSHELCNELSAFTVAKALDGLTIFGCFKDDSMKDYFDPSSPKALKETLTLKHAILEFVTDHITSSAFLDGMLQISSMEQIQAQPVYLSMLEHFLLYLNEANSKMGTNPAEKTQWSDIVEASYTAVESINQLLSISGFVNAISKLLQHTDPEMRKRALILLNNKIADDHQVLSQKEIQLFLGMLGELSKILERTGKNEELDINKQSALLCIEILTRNLAAKQPAVFVNLVPSIISTMKHPNEQVISSAVITLATLVHELGAAIIPHLPQFYPLVLRIIQSSSTGSNKAQSKARYLLQISTLSSLDVIVTHIANFLSPYVAETVTLLTSSKLLSNSSEKVSRKIKNVLEKIAKMIAPRLLLPSVVNAYKDAFQTMNTESLRLIFDFFGTICTKMDLNFVQGQYKRLLKMFLAFFDLRHQEHAPDQAAILKVEQHCIRAFLAMVVKLNENMFKPLFLKIVEWMQETEQNERAVNRRPFFYHLLDALIEKLKGIFVPYFGYVLDDLVGQLKTCQDDTMLSSILLALNKCFLYDTEGFINKERFDKLMQPLVDLLEKNEKVIDDLVPCLGQLAVCIGTETLWKPLNYQVTLKSHHTSPKVRLAAVKTLQEFYTRLGEEFLVLLPETVPHIAELMEDSDPDVEQQCQKLIAQIEVFLGEDSISSYF